MANVKPTEGPREPWHDIHSKLEGSIAHDVFINFRERWDKQGLRDNEKTVEVMTLDDNFFDLQCCTSKEFEKRWSCQLFRSITEDSAEFDDKRTSKLNSKMGRYIDQSIVQA